MKNHRFLQGVIAFVLITLTVAAPLTALGAPTSQNGFVIKTDPPQNSAAPSLAPLPPAASPAEPSGEGATAFSPAPSQDQEAPETDAQQSTLPTGGQTSGQPWSFISEIEDGEKLPYADASEESDADALDEEVTVTAHVKEGASRGYLVISKGQDGWEVKSELYPSLLLTILFHVFSILFTCALIFAIAQLIVALRRRKR